MRPGYPSAWGNNRKYRYVLWRYWDDSLPYLNFIGLNPSIADDEKKDPTITRDIGYTKGWTWCNCGDMVVPGPCSKACKTIQAGGFCKTNLFAFVDTHPESMRAEKDPEGEENMHWLKACASGALGVIACWGAGGSHRAQGEKILMTLPWHNGPWCLGMTANRQPAHPLYLKKDLQLVKVDRGALDDDL